VLVWHATFLVNSAAHVFGRRRYDTSDTSRNSLAVAVATMGEGWHNNHHYDPNAARQGRRWYEVDPTYWGLRVLAWLGFVWDLREPRGPRPASKRDDDLSGVLAGEHRVERVRS